MSNLRYVTDKQFASIETFEFPTLLLESRRDGLNWILEWELDGVTELEVLYYIRITSYSGGKIVMTTLTNIQP